MNGWGGRELPDNWPSLRRRVLDRDAYRCQALDPHGFKCGAPATQVDHITPYYLGGADSLDNLQALCAHHHALKTSAEGIDARRRKTAARRAEQRALRERARAQYRE